MEVVVAGDGRSLIGALAVTPPPPIPDRVLFRRSAKWGPLSAQSTPRSSPRTSKDCGPSSTAWIPRLCSRHPVAAVVAVAGDGQLALVLLYLSKAGCRVTAIVLDVHRNVTEWFEPLVVFVFTAGLLPRSST